MPDVLRAVPDVENEDAAEEAIKQAVSAAAGNLEEMRAIEGRKLSEDLIMRGRLVRDIVKKIDKRAPAVARGVHRQAEKQDRRVDRRRGTDT